MAFTVTRIPGPKYRRHGRQKVVMGTLTFDTSYATGGEALTAAELGLSVITHINVHAAGGYVFTVPTTLPATSILVMAWWQNEVAASVLVEVTAATNLSTVVGVRFTAYGR